MDRSGSGGVRRRRSVVAFLRVICSSLSCPLHRVDDRAAPARRGHRALPAGVVLDGVGAFVKDHLMRTRRQLTDRRDAGPCDGDPKPPASRSSRRCNGRTPRSRTPAPGRFAEMPIWAARGSALGVVMARRSVWTVAAASSSHVWAAGRCLPPIVFARGSKPSRGGSSDNGFPSRRWKGRDGDVWGHARCGTPLLPTRRFLVGGLRMMGQRGCARSVVPNVRSRASGSESRP